MSATSRNLVIGAGGAIGTAVAEALASPDQRLLTVSRSGALTLSAEVPHTHLQCDYSPEAIAHSAARIADQAGALRRVVICNGRLHDKGIWPEKRIEDIRPAALQAIFNSNALLPMQWLQALAPALKGSDPCVVAVLSARIGSISDNALGGWYGYRMSKAALNMGLQTAAIEFGRRAKNVRLLAFHPGTTDSALSTPFQGSVPPDKLFSPAFVADRLLAAMVGAASQPAGQAQFLDWQGKTIPW